MNSSPSPVTLAAIALLQVAVIIPVTLAACLQPKFSIVVNHTGCLNPTTYSSATPVTSPADQSNIVAYHNIIRRAARAADMQAVTWDAEIASLAQNWANNCQFMHDGNAQRSVPGKYAVGQNLGYGYRDWNGTMNAWAAEVDKFVYGGTPTGMVGHYTQMVWASTSRVGCGAAYCSNLKATLYVCNYAPAGNLDATANRPYAKPATSPGEQCGTINNGLCDCGGKTCYNDGVLDLKTCSCKCSQPYFIAPSCDLKCTDASDNSSCGLWQQLCTTYYNVPYYCPNACKLCPLAGIDYGNP